MQTLAATLEKESWVLRSGGADGADFYFERGVKDSSNKEIYLPSASFNGRYSLEPGCHNFSFLPGAQAALETVAKYHPAPSRLTPFAQKLMARNAMQVLGPDLQTPSCAVVCWTPGGRMEGGTSQAIRIALDHKIPVHNLGTPATYSALHTLLRQKQSLTGYLLQVDENY